MQKHICLKQAVILAPISNFFATIAALCNKHETSSRKYITDFSGNIRLSSVGSKGHVCRLFLAKRGLERRAKWVYNLVARSARAVCEPRVGPSELQSRRFHLYLYISDGVRHDVIQRLTSGRIFVSRQHSTESNFKFPSMTKALMKSCVFVVCKTMFTIGESQAISHANRTANTRTPNCQSSQGKIWHRKILWTYVRTSR